MAADGSDEEAPDELLSDEEAQYRRDKRSFASSSIAQLFPSLRHGIWHVTSPAAMLGILETGQIRPDRRDLPYSHAQSANSYGFYKGYVCVFDFGVLGEREYVDFHDRWQGFFYAHSPFTVAVELDRSVLADRLIPNAAAWKEFRAAKVWIPHVEAWHDGPIDLAAAALRCLLIPRSDASHLPKIIQLGDPDLCDVLQEAASGAPPRQAVSVRAEVAAHLQEWEQAEGA